MPFAALKLLRLHLGYELPGAAWRDWSISRGKLCTPEGHELNPQDAAWWWLLIRRAHVGVLALRELRQLKDSLVGGADAPAASARRGAPVHGDTGADAAGVAAMTARADPQGLRRAAPLDLSNGHNRTTHRRETGHMALVWRQSDATLTHLGYTHDMRTTIRLPEDLASDVRQRCERLGISVNALVCVALDAWLRVPAAPVAMGDARELDRPAAPAAAVPDLTPKQRYELDRAARKAARKR